jgi:hypothetical protein|tara:strand:+ start:3105 stop:3797 length:693 start_codon:yes stop_codon:yes gene_type:complete
MIEVRASFSELTTVPHSCGRNNDYSSATVMDPPAQLDIVAMERDRRIESADLTKQVSPDQHERRWQREHVAHSIVLFLVNFAGVDSEIDLTKSVETEPDRLQQSRVVPFDELRTDNASVRTVDLFDEGADRVGFRSNIVVAQKEEPVVTFDEPQHFVSSGTKPRILSDASDKRIRDPHANARLKQLICDLGKKEKPDVWVVLIGERLERFFEPWTRFVNDDDRNDWRRLW